MPTTTTPEPHNKLTPAEIERLAYLSEECGEVIQVIGKILRHGYESYHPHDPNKITNRELLMSEIFDMLRGVGMLQRANDIAGEHRGIPLATATSIPISEIWFHHQDD